MLASSGGADLKAAINIVFDFDCYNRETLVEIVLRAPTRLHTAADLPAPAKLRFADRGPAVVKSKRDGS